MSLKLQTILLVLFLCFMKTLASTTAACRTCINDANSKWCGGHIGDDEDGTCCAMTNSAGICDQSTYTCSNEAIFSGTQAKYVICERDSTMCTNTGATFNSKSDSETFRDAGIAIDSHCTYRLDIDIPTCGARSYCSTSYMNKITIKVENATNVKIDLIHREDNVDMYIFIKELAENETISFDFSRGDDELIYLVVTPLDANNFVNIKANASGNEQISFVVLFFTIFGSIIAGILLVVGVVFLFIWLCSYWEKKQGERKINTKYTMVRWVMSKDNAVRYYCYFQRNYKRRVPRTEYKNPNMSQVMKEARKEGGKEVMKEVKNDVKKDPIIEAKKAPGSTPFKNGPSQPARNIPSPHPGEQNQTTEDLIQPVLPPINRRLPPLEFIPELKGKNRSFG